MQDIANTNKVSLNSDLANKVISSISVDLGSLENDLAAFPTTNSFDVLNLDKAVVTSDHGPSSAHILLDNVEGHLFGHFWSSCSTNPFFCHIVNSWEKRP